MNQMCVYSIHLGISLLFVIDNTSKRQLREKYKDETILMFLNNIFRIKI